MRLIIIVATVLQGVATLAQSAPTTQTADFELHEWVVLVAGANQPVANATTAFKSTMPAFINSRRPDAPPDARDQPMPIGVIRILSNALPDNGPKIDVLLQPKSGQFNAHSPAAQAKSNRLLWTDMSLSASAPAGIAKVEDEHWFGKLRAGASAYLIGNKEKDEGSDRMLVYDVELPYALPLKVQADGAKPFAYRIANTGQTPVHDLELYKSSEGNCRVAFLPELAATKSPATKPATAPATRPEDAFSAVTATSPTTSPSTRPTTLAATSQPVGTPVALESRSGKAEGAIAAAWKSRLAHSGLTPIDHELICAILARYGADANHLTAIYRLDPAELDQLLPLEVVPAPRKTVRVGLVIARDIDPAIATEIADLVKRLGDDDWNARESASKELSQLGPTAKPQLEAAIKSNDPEVATRAERLLAGLNKAGGAPAP